MRTRKSFAFAAAVFCAAGSVLVPAGAHAAPADPSSTTALPSTFRTYWTTSTVPGPGQWRSVSVVTDDAGANHTVGTVKTSDQFTVSYSDGSNVQPLAVRVDAGSEPTVALTRNGLPVAIWQGRAAASRRDSTGNRVTKSERQVHVAAAPNWITGAVDAPRSDGKGGWRTEVAVDLSSGNTTGAYATHSGTLFHVSGTGAVTQVYKSGVRTLRYASGGGTEAVAFTTRGSLYLGTRLRTSSSSEGKWRVTPIADTPAAYDVVVSARGVPTVVFGSRGGGLRYLAIDPARSPATGLIQAKEASSVPALTGVPMAELSAAVDSSGSVFVSYLTTRRGSCSAPVPANYITCPVRSIEALTLPAAGDAAMLPSNAEPVVTGMDGLPIMAADMSPNGETATVAWAAKDGVLHLSTGVPPQLIPVEADDQANQTATPPPSTTSTPQAPQTPQTPNPRPTATLSPVPVG